MGCDVSYVTAPPMIAYAGQEGPPKARQGLSAYSMFKLGYDTMQIAEHFGLPESVVVKRIHRDRDKKLGIKTQVERPS